MNRLPVCTEETMAEETMAAAIDAMRMARRQADETILLGESTTDEGDKFHVIRDTLAEPGQRLLWKTPVLNHFISAPVAYQKLQELRDRRVVLAIIATLPQ